MIRFYTLSAAAALIACNSMSAWAADPLLTETHKVLPAALAVEAAQAAIAACKAQGYNVTVTIVDRAGLPKLVLVGDGARDLTRQVTSRKAYTSSSLGRSTGELVKMLSSNPAAEGMRNMNEKILILGGGLPVKAGEELIGGIGVGGAPGGDKDEACAQAGLDKIKNRLK